MIPKGEIGQRAKDLLRRIAVKKNVEILSGSISPDHVYLLVSIGPSMSVIRLVKYLKGKTSRKLQMEFS